MSKTKDEVRVLLFVPVLQKTLELSFSSCLKVKEATLLCKDLLLLKTEEKPACTFRMLWMHAGFFC